MNFKYLRYDQKMQIIAQPVQNVGQQERYRLNRSYDTASSKLWSAGLEKAFLCPRSLQPILNRSNSLDIANDDAVFPAM